MIVTVTLNPAIDKTVTIDEFYYGGLNRIKSVVQDPAGKGINVSKTIHSLGGKSIATGFIAGSSGRMIREGLDKLGIVSDFIQVPGESRTNMKVVDAKGKVTELNEPGPVIEEAVIEELLKKLYNMANADSIFVLAGSIPRGVDGGIYRKITELVKRKNAKVFLDADGELFMKGLEAKPDYIKPNRFELEQYFDVKGSTSIEDLVLMGRKLQDKGISNIAITLGSEGALFLLPQLVIKVPGLTVEAHSTVGAGDAMVAALAYGLDVKLSQEECLTLGIATSAGAVTTVGTKPPTKELVEELKQKVSMTILD